MKRRKLLVAAIASLMTSTACAALGVAGEPGSSSAHYSIGDTGTVQHAAAHSRSTASLNRTAAHTTAAKSNTAASTATTSCTAGVADEAACDPCNDGDRGDACQDACDACCDDGCGSGLWFVEAEALGWWRKSRALPPLATTSIPGTLQVNAGVLGLGSTRVLFGGENVEDGIGSGGRISFGRFLSAEKELGVAASFFALDQEEISFTADSTNGILAIPFFNAGLVTPAEGSLLVNFPGVSQNGSVNINAQNDVLGADVYLRKLMIADANFRVDLIGGYQFSRVDDGLTINATFDDVSGIPNENFNITDTFQAQNEFHGGSVGVLAYVDHGRWTVKGIAKCGLGNMRQTIDISGQTITTASGVSAVTPSGLFALPTNIGSFSNDEFGIIPEAKLNFGYRLTENWTFGAGYSFIYWNDLATAGGAIDRNVNLTQVPGPPGLGTALVPSAPAFQNNTDFWVQGINLSAEFTY